MEKIGVKTVFTATLLLASCSGQTEQISDQSSKASVNEIVTDVEQEELEELLENISFESARGLEINQTMDLKSDLGNTIELYNLSQYEVDEELLNKFFNYIDEIAQENPEFSLIIPNGGPISFSAKANTTKNKYMIIVPSDTRYPDMLVQGFNYRDELPNALTASFSAESASVSIVQYESDKTILNSIITEICQSTYTVESKTPGYGQYGQESVCNGLALAFSSAYQGYSYEKYKSTLLDLPTKVVPGPNGQDIEIKLAPFTEVTFDQLKELIED